jgi:threonine dehydrogenase-like Zn-dependent dehydrogenase
MFAIAAYPGRPEPALVEMPEPRAPGAGEVLCRTLQVGVCGTDREILHSREPMTPRDQPFLVLGHECLARVEAVGPGVTELTVGDLVTPLVRRADAPSDLRADMLAFGTFVERGIYLEHGFSSPWWLDRAESLFRVPSAIAEIAILTEPLSVVEKGVNEALLLQQARLGPEVWSVTPPRVLVTGLGPIGFAGVLACVARGWPVAVYGRDEASSFRAQLVEELGGSYLPDAQSVAQSSNLERDGFDLVLECTGSDEVMLATAAAMRARAIMCWLGSERLPRAKSFNLGALMRDGLIRNQLFIGCVNSAPRDFRDALQHLALLHQRMPGTLAKLITNRVAPRESLRHYTHREPQGIKVVLEYDA